MLGFLDLLPRGLTTFLFALAALLRLYGSSSSIPIPAVPLTLLGWSLAAFLLASAALLLSRAKLKNAAQLLSDSFSWT